MCVERETDGQPNGCVFLNHAHDKMAKQPVRNIAGRQVAFVLVIFLVGSLIEMIEEGGDTCERWFLLVFDFDGKFDFHFADATEVGNGLQRGDEAYALSAQNGLAKFHLVHAVVDHHLQVVDFNNLLPHVGEEGECQVAVNDCLSEGASFCTLWVNVDPLVVEGGIGKLVDAFLADFEPFGCAENFAHMCGEVVVGVDDKFLHNVWGCFFVWAVRLSCASAVFDERLPGGGKRTFWLS